MTSADVVVGARQHDPPTARSSGRHDLQEGGAPDHPATRSARPPGALRSSGLGSDVPRHGGCRRAPPGHPWPSGPRAGARPGTAPAGSCSQEGRRRTGCPLARAGPHRRSRTTVSSRRPASSARPGGCPAPSPTRRGRARRAVVGSPLRSRGHARAPRRDRGRACGRPQPARSSRSPSRTRARSRGAHPTARGRPCRGRRAQSPPTTRSRASDPRPSRAGRSGAAARPPVTATSRRLRRAGAPESRGRQARARSRVRRPSAVAPSAGASARDPALHPRRHRPASAGRGRTSRRARPARGPVRRGPHCRDQRRRTPRPPVRGRQHLRSPRAGGVAETPDHPTDAVAELG